MVPPTEGLPATLFLQELDRELESLALRGELELPPYPAVALRVQEALGRPDFGLDEVARLVGSDAALAAAVLRCANSPLYRRGATATSLTQAIIRVGAHEVMRLLLASCLAAHAHTAGPLAPLRRMIWIEGLCGAALCQELARLRGLKQEEAFLAGLLHDFGKIVACTSLEKIVEKRAGEGTGTAQAWRALIDRHHVALGAALATRWKLPPTLADIIGHHHEEGVSAGDGSGLLDVVRMSDAIVALLVARPGISSADLGGVPGLGKFVEREAVVRVIQKIPEFVDAFESNGAASAGPSPRIEPPATTLDSAGRPVRFGVTVVQGRKSRQFTAHTIASNGLAMVGNEPLLDGRLHETTIHSQPGPLHIWSLARLSRRDGGSYHVEVHPFALSGVERGLWSQLALGDPSET
ncbi:MAG TPA: HDOD domain-containing protein [Anaeromyxobacteraceae bacterium]|nr:HDOD domain-containing protein [Anaeromyxobacteraceae bacterium]